MYTKMYNNIIISLIIIFTLLLILTIILFVIFKKKKCHNCFKKIDKDSNYCKYCGTKVIK